MMHDQDRLARCILCGAWTLVPKHLAAVKNAYALCTQCAEVTTQGIDKADRLTALQGGAPEEAQTAARSARWDTNSARYTQPVDN